jgi:alpha-beta hydrolase superfamily lysophospholipase
MSQRAAAAIAGDAIGIDNDGLEGFSHISLLLRLPMIAAVVLAVMLASCAPTVIPAGEAVQAPALGADADRYVAADGTALPLAVWPAEGGPPKAVILGLHGFGDYRNAWEEPAELWVKDGITTYAYDQRGFGKSPTRGRWPGTQTLADDAKAVAALLRARYPGVPLYLAGESLGGSIALVAADQGAPVDGLILASAALRSRDTLGPLVSGAVWFFAHTVPWLPNGPTSIDYKPTDNPKTLEKLSKDPLMLRQARADMAYGLIESMDAAKVAAGRIKLPYIMLHGMGDRLIPERPVRSAIEIMPVRPDSKLVFYANGYHLLLRDKDGIVVARDVAAWIADKKAPLPSGAEAEHSRPEIAAVWGTRHMN